MSKRKRAERLIGKTIETEYHGPARVLAVETPDDWIYNSGLAFRVQYVGEERWHKDRIELEKVNSRVRYKILDKALT